MLCHLQCCRKWTRDAQCNWQLTSLLKIWVFIFLFKVEFACNIRRKDWGTPNSLAVLFYGNKRKCSAVSFSVKLVANFYIPAKEHSYWNLCFVLFLSLTSASLLLCLWRYKMLQQTSGVEESGVLRWELFLILILAWIIIYFCIFKGVKSTGKVRQQRDNETEENDLTGSNTSRCVCV